MAISSLKASDNPELRLARIEQLLGTDPMLAEQQAAEILAEIPGHAMALLFQGIARRMRKDAPSAIEILEPLCKRFPDAPLAHLQLGLALREVRRSADAVAPMRQAVALKPSLSSAWLALADLLTELGDTPGADQAFTMYIRHSATEPALMNAAAALRAGRVAEARSLLAALLQQNPNDVAAMCLQADALTRDGLVGDAEALLKVCLQLAPSYRDARYNYAVILMRQDKSEAALQEVNRLLEAEPVNTGIRSLKAAVLARLGEYEESARVYESLLVEQPNQQKVWTSLGHVLRTLGQRDRCVEAYRRAIALAPEYGEAYWNLANLKTFQPTDAELESMRAQLCKPGLADEDRLHFHFAIGKALADRGDFSDSFEHFAEGNRIRRQSISHTPEEMSAYVRRCRTLFTSEFFKQREGYGADSRDPIFIIGLPRTGSTLVEQILASHSGVEGTRELFTLSSIAMSLLPRTSAAPGLHYPDVLKELGKDTSRELGLSYLEQTRCQRKLGTPYFIDKMPNNFAHVGLIHLILPSARIIDVRRHPLACGVSIFKHLFASGQNFSYRLEDIGAHYRSYVELMAHFDAVLPGRIYRVHYESLVKDTEAEVRRLLDYCELAFEEACLGFHSNRRSVYTPSSEQVRSPIFREGLDHWHHYEPWLGPLRAALGGLDDTYPDVPWFSVGTS